MLLGFVQHCLLFIVVFEKIRNVHLHTYKFDPPLLSHNSKLSWDAMLKLTKVEFKLLKDYDMYIMLGKKIELEYHSML